MPSVSALNRPKTQHSSVRCHRDISDASVRVIAGVGGQTGAAPDRAGIAVAGAAGETADVVAIVPALVEVHSGIAVPHGVVCDYVPRSAANEHANLAIDECVPDHLVVAHLIVKIQSLHGRRA